MNYNAQKYYNGTIAMEEASNLATEIDNALDTLPGMGWFSDFEYKSELKDICNDIFSIRSGCTAICNCIAMGFSNLCSLDTDFNLEYTRISQIEFSKLSEAEQQEYAYIKEYTDKEAMNYLEKNFKDIDFAGLSKEEVETYEFMTGSNVDEIILSKQEYENMSWYEKAGANVSTFGLSVFESLVNLGEGIVDAGIWLTGTAVSNGLVVTIADALVEEDLKGMIKDKMYDAIDYDFSANMYDTIVEKSGLNTYVAYGTAHTVGNAVGDYLGYYALSCVPVVGPALCAVAGAGTAIEGNVQNQKANNENGEINDLSVFGSAVGGAFSGYFKGKITKQIVKNGTSIITDLAKNGASGTTATILKSINGKNALNILKNEIKSAGFWFDFGSNAVLSGSEAVVEYNNTGSVDLVKTAKGFAGRFLLDRTLDKVASTDFNEFENPASLMDAAKGIKGFVTSGYNSSKKMLGEKITIATNKVKTIGTSVADTVKNAKNNFDLFTINMMNNPKVSKIINDLNDPFYYNVAGGDGIKFFGAHMLKEMLPILANKRAVKNVLDNADFTQKLLKEGMVHFAPSEDVADAIISSKVLKTKRLKMDVLHPFETIKHNAYYVANQGNKTFLFGGIPSYEEMLLNVEIQPKMVGVRIKTDASQLGDIGYRYLDDNALIHSGDLDLSTANSVEKVYVGLKYDKNTNKYFYDELTKEEFDNFEMDISEDVFKKLKSGTTKSKKQIDLMYGSLKQQLDERTHIEVFDLKSEYNKSIDDIRLSSNYEDETARLSDIRKIWEEDLKAVFGEDNVEADDVSDILAKASIVQMGAGYQNRNLERELINDLFDRKETLSSDMISKIEGNDYWTKALNEEQEKFTKYSNGLENWKNSNTPKVLSAEEVKKLQGMSWDEIGKDEKSLRWTYLSQNLGVDLDNIPKSILLTEVKGLDSSIAEDINKTQSYYRKVCIDDLVGSSSKPGSDASGNTFLEKVLFDKGYQGSAKDHMYDDLLESLKREYTDLNLGKEASTGNVTIDLLEHKGKYYIGEDGNHRMVALKVKFMQEMENAKTIEEMAQIREKYTFVLPVKSLDLPIPEIKEVNTLNMINNTLQKNSNNNVIDLKNQVVNLKSNLADKGFEDDLSIARAVYFNLAENVSYSQIDTKFTGLNFAKTIDNNYLSNANRNVICYSWASLYKECLKEAGINPENIKVLEWDAHHNVCFKANNKYFIADASYGYSNGACPDLLAIKIGREPSGFFEISRSQGEMLFNGENLTGQNFVKLRERALEEHGRKNLNEDKLVTSYLFDLGTDEKIFEVDYGLGRSSKQFRKKASDLQKTLANIAFNDKEKFFTPAETIDLFVKEINEGSLNATEVYEIYHMTLDEKVFEDIKLATYNTLDDSAKRYSLLSWFQEEGKIRHFLKSDYDKFIEVDDIDSKLKELNIDVNSMIGDRY